MNSPLNVCLLNDSFPPVIDGVANAVLNYAGVIQRDLGGAVVVTPRYPGGRYDYPFPVVSYPSVKTSKTAGYRMGLPLPGIVRAIRSHPIDIIHCHCPLVSAVISKTLRQATGAPVVMTYHTKFDVDIANAFDSGLVRTVAKKIIVSNIEACDEVWAVSRGAAENLRSLGYGGSCRVMDNGVDFPKGAADGRLIRIAVSELGLPPDMPVFLFVGRMMWYKNLRLILDGLSRAKNSGLRFKMVFVGGGADFDGVRRRAEALGMKHDCVFTGPVRDREKLRAYYSLADMFLFPSTFDSAPIAVREAAACSLASLLVRGSSSADCVTDGVNGILIDEDADSLASAVAALAKNRERLKELGRHAMESIYLSWDDAVGRAYERYRELLEDHKAGVGRGA